MKSLIVLLLFAAAYVISLATSLGGLPALQFENTPTPIIIERHTGEWLRVKLKAVAPEVLRFTQAHRAR